MTVKARVVAASRTAAVQRGGRVRQAKLLSPGEVLTIVVNVEGEGGDMGSPGDEGGECQ